MADGGGDPRRQLVAGDPHTLDEVLDRLEITEDGEDEKSISIGELRDVVGRRSFGPFLLVAGLLALTPVGVVPGVPTTLAVIVVLMGGQMLLGLEGIWLPQLVLRRSIKERRLRKSIGYLRPVARVVDRLLRPRLTFFTHGAAVYAIAVACVLLGAMIPPLEFVPFAVTVPAVALALFGLAVITRDGLVALLGFGISAAGIYLVVSNLLV